MAGKCVCADLYQLAIYSPERVCSSIFTPVIQNYSKTKAGRWKIHEISTVDKLRKMCNKIEKNNRKYVRTIVDEVALVLPERHLPELVAELLVGYHVPEQKEKPVRPLRKCRRV